MVNYGGDEVSALVLDFGSSSLRAGYAGDDAPKAIVPTYYGFKRQASTDGDVTMTETGEPSDAPTNEASSPVKSATMYIGQHGPSIWRDGMEIQNPVRDGLIQDFNPVPALVSHALADCMRVDPADHPILVTEPAWNTPENRERMAEIMFEEFNAPAFYIANTSVLNAFAAGKGSALVVDIGQKMASAVPVVDGFVLRKGLATSSLPTLVHAHARHILTNATQSRGPIDLSPHQLIASKSPVEPNAPPRFTLKEERIAGTTRSWRAWSEAREVEEWIQSVCGMLPQGWNDHAAMQQPQRPYEFPSGFNAYFGMERFTVGEQYFHHSAQLAQSNANLPRTVPQLMNDALRACDVDLRQVLVGNIVLTGGGSLMAGFTDRLNNELVRGFPHVKIHAPGNPTERRYGGWLGGSVLASLGTFHQLWISKEEWMEHGKSIVAQRCK